MLEDLGPPNSNLFIQVNIITVLNYSSPSTWTSLGRQALANRPPLSCDICRHTLLTNEKTNKTKNHVIEESFLFPLSLSINSFTTKLHFPHNYFQIEIYYSVMNKTSLATALVPIQSQSKTFPYYLFILHDRLERMQTMDQ